MSYDTIEDGEKSTFQKIIRSKVWKQVAYAGIGFLIVAIIAAIVLILVLTYKSPAKKKVYTFESMFDSTLVPQSFSADWSPSNAMLYWRYQNVSTIVQPQRAFTHRRLNSFERATTMQYDAKDEPNDIICTIVARDPITAEEKVIFTQNDFATTVDCGSLFIISSDSKYLILQQKGSIEKVFRHSTQAKYLIYDIAAKTFQNLSPNAANKQKAVLWCPSGSAVGFVENNNLFLKTFPTGTVTQVTNDGDNELIFNGVTDWLYEEEVFGAVESFVWNNDCSKVAWLRLDDTDVNTYRYEEYQADSPYPIEVNIRIPTPNYTNPAATVHIYNTADNQVLNVNLGPVNTGDINKDFYVYDLKWADANNLAVVTVPRLQQKKQIWLANTATAVDNTIQPSVIRTETIDTWIQYARSVMFLSNVQYIDLVGFNNSYHIGLFDVTNSQPVRYLTSGDFEVTDIYAFNKDTNEVYYASTEVDSTERHIYAVNVASGEKRSLTDDKKAGYYSASFSADAQYYILNYQGPELPYTLLKSTDSAKNITQTLVENSSLKKVLADYVLPQTQITTLKNAEGDDMNTMFVFPPDWTSGTQVQYPVLFYLYGGPGSQLVTKSWASMHNAFSYYMAAQGFIVVTVDSRGTGFKGIKYMTTTYKNLGRHEVEDQIFAGKTVAARADTDGVRMAIWGWSYGGYMASKTASSTLNDGVFALGVSVAPVTDWRYYDSAYTERYMQWPGINQEGYYNSSVITQVRNTECPLLPSTTTNVNGQDALQQSATRLVLVHGTGDDNVHPLNSYNLMTELQNNQVQFETMFYPNKDHSIAGVNTRRQLYRFLANRLQQHLIDQCVV